MNESLMAKKATSSCILLGSKSLLIQCAQILLENKFDITAVVTDDPGITDWARSQNIRIVSYQKYSELNDLKNIDYIFSITNLRIVPDNILKLAKVAAINYHDGPLPAYAGLNVTTWALANQETTHAVTWHEMLVEVDTGKIYREEDIEIETNETAFTLNAKCYEVALNLFKEIVGDITSNKLQSVEQATGEGHFFGRCHRMPAMEVLDWRKSASELDAMVRALDYGPYENPVGVPKIIIEDQVFYIKELEVTDKVSEQVGKCHCQNNDLIIDAGDYGVKLKKIIKLNNNVISEKEFLEKSRIQHGDILPLLENDIIADIANLDRQYCSNENQIIKGLLGYQSAEIPYANAVTSSADIPISKIIKQQFTKNAEKTIHSMVSEDEIFALVGLYLSKLSGMDCLSVGYRLKRRLEIVELLFEQMAPINFEINGQELLSDFIIANSQLLKDKQEKGGYIKEIALCRPELNQTTPDYMLQFNKISSLENSEPGNIPGLQLIVDNTKAVAWAYNPEIYSADSIKLMQSQFNYLLEQIAYNENQSLFEYTLISESDLEKMLYQWNQTDTEYDRNKCIHHLFEDQVAKQPDAVAVSFSGESVTYAELNRKANQIANYLVGRGVKPDSLVGILVDRSVDMIAAMLGVLKSGGAYLPLDPTYPKERINYMLEDGNVVAVISQSHHSAYLLGVDVSTLYLDTDEKIISQEPDSPVVSSDAPSNLAYTIYTSGSTGKPKGVMVEHGNVVNFFSGMDQRLGTKKGVWLAVTSISFDISVLEIFWTLANGFEIALYADQQRKSSKVIKTKYPDQDMEFSLFYWNVAEDESEYDEDKYNLLLESAKFGDRNNFKAVWTPERHFHAFGGLYPNPSVTSAAIATITKQIEIRAGSCVAPLHHPIRITEEWSMVDNFSHGRVGMAFAAGWQPNDFVILPDNHAEAKNIMFQTIETVKKLWRGETLEFPGPKGDMVKVRTLPRPVQKELPIWITTAGNPETFKQAGEVGANVLTHLLGQSVEDVAKNIAVYKEAFKTAGHKGEGHVTLLLHTLVGTDEEKVRELARTPMKNYLKSAMFLVKAAAWHFPTFKTLSEETGQSLDEIFDNISDDDLDGLLEFAFERYYSTSGLFGTPERGVEMVDRLKEIGVNEIGCLIDYGLDTQNVLDHLPYLNDLRKVSIKQDDVREKIDSELSIPDIMSTRKVTHLQCTPSMASMLVSDDASASGLKSLKHMMVGGEAFPKPLAEKLSQIVSGRVTNMYGPTETTIWSSTKDINTDEQSIAIGKPIANTQMYILDRNLKPVSVGVAGELYIGGDGVVRGYHNRIDLTNERFIPNPFVKESSALIYKTGDLAKYRSDGTVEYIGRIDHQIKIRGYRIELGEIESLIQSHTGIDEAVVLLREDVEGDKRLVAYIKPISNAVLDQNVIKSYLKNDLPEFMLPTIFVEVASMPLTPNGKIDRKALPPPKQDKQISATAKYVQPENELQKTIVEIWQEILGLPQVGLEDNFFDIGGHSLLVVQVLDRLRKVINTPVKMMDMFRFPTINSLSNYLGQSGADDTKLVDSKDRAEARKSAMLKRRRNRK